MLRGSPRTQNRGQYQRMATSDPDQRKHIANGDGEGEVDKTIWSRVQESRSKLVSSLSVFFTTEKELIIRQLLGLPPLELPRLSSSGPVFYP